MLLGNEVFIFAYANDVDALIPEFWAQESLVILEERMVIGNLVHRDFENQLAKFGDTVNTRRPAELRALRKTNADNVTIQDVSTVNVPVRLDQHFHTSFMIKDGEETLAMKELVQFFLSPAVLAISRAIDRLLLGQVYQYIPNMYGSLGGLTSSNGKEYILGTRNVMNVNKAWEDNRRILLTPNSETTLLSNDGFTSAEKVGDQGTALRTASLGHKLGFDLYMSQNTPSIQDLGASAVDSDTTAAAAVVGATTVTLTTGTATSLVAGNWLKIEGDDQPHQISAYDGGTKVVTLYLPLKKAVASGAEVTVMKQGAVDLVAGYAAGYSKEIKYDTFPVDPKLGQLVSFKTETGIYYTIIDIDSTANTFILDRPLESTLANNNAISIAPHGEYNFAFHRDALAFVSRPLAMPMAGTGARSAVVSANGIGIRSCITYSGEKQGHLVTLDLLCGVKVLDVNLGAIMLG